MKRLAILFLGLIICFQSCQISEEISFNEDGSGNYEMTFDMSEMMKMGGAMDTLPPEPPVDTVITFATFLDEKKDSIAQLPNEERQQLEVLRPLKFAMKSNEEEKQLDINVIYPFKKIEDLSKFAEAIENANIKELQEMTGPMSELNPETPSDSVEQKDPMSEMFSMAKSFNTSFSKTGFSRSITDEARAEAVSKKDTTIKADDPFVDMIRFKQVYRFPYKVKSVSNSNAKILSDFKGVEIEANMYELNNDPDFFNIEVTFHNE
ncbi:MAG: hypothetical protein AB3N14_10075 [Flavobacteriaceae bacterium]